MRPSTSVSRPQPRLKTDFISSINERPVDFDGKYDPLKQGFIEKIIKERQQFNSNTESTGQKTEWIDPIQKKVIIAEEMAGTEEGDALKKDLGKTMFNKSSVTHNIITHVDGKASSRRGKRG